MQQDISSHTNINHVYIKQKYSNHVFIWYIDYLLYNHSFTTNTMIKLWSV